jgi:hypothetical protein
MKMVAVAAPKDDAIALLADCEQTREDMRKKDPVILNRDSDEPPKKTKNEGSTAKTVEKPKDNKGKQKEKERKKGKPEMDSPDIDMDEADDVEPEKAKQKEKGDKKRKAKQKKEQKKKQPEANPSDIDMDEVSDVEPKKGKQREAAPTKREMELEAKIKELRRLVKMKGAEEPADSNADSTADSDAGSATADSEPEEQDAKKNKKGKASTKTTKKPPAKDDPKLFTFYKTIDDESQDMAMDMKLRFTRQMFLNWWPEESDHQAYGTTAYEEALKQLQNTVILDSDDEVIERRRKSLTYIRVAQAYFLFDSTVSNESQPHQGGK